jgi:hypothetical protein
MNQVPLVTFCIDGNRVFLSWTETPGATGYIIARTPSQGFKTVSTSTCSNFYAGTVLEDYSYTYTVTPYTGTAPHGEFTRWNPGTVIVKQQ